MNKSGNFVQYRTSRTLLYCYKFFASIAVAVTLLIAAALLLHYGITTLGYIVLGGGLFFVLIATVFAAIYKLSYRVTVENGEIYLIKGGTSGQWRIRSVKHYYVRRGFWGTLFNYGDVYLKIEHDDYDVVLRKICNPFGLIKAINYYDGSE
ncbi:MAG: hypothetical protein NC099_01365 [Corallococcus sp.]|nr:hypothetical protein [Corallococcus sp.]